MTPNLDEHYTAIVTYLEHRRTQRADPVIAAAVSYVQSLPHRNIDILTRLYGADALHVLAVLIALYEQPEIKAAVEQVVTMRPRSPFN